MIRLLRHDDTVPRDNDGTVKFRRPGINIWFITYVFFALVNSNMAKFLAKRRWNQEEIPRFLYLRAIQGHDGGKHMDFTLQDNVLLPDDFAEHIYRAGSSHDLHFIIQSGLIPGEKVSRMGGMLVFFTAVNPIWSARRSRVRPDEAQNRSEEKQLEKHTNMQFFGVTGGLFRVKDCSSIKHDPTQSFFTTLYPRCASRRWWTWSQEMNCTVKCISLLCFSAENCAQAEFALWTPGYYQLWSESHPSTILAESTERPVTGEYGETRCGNIDLRIQGLPQSTVQQQDDTRREAVNKLIHQFETHPNREPLKADLEKDQAFNPFSEKSKDMIHSMGNTEYFEMCEITSKVQCHNCLTHWTTGIVYCACGTCLRTS